MTHHYYGHENRYGLGTSYQRPDGTLDDLPGAILRFTDRKARDAWIAQDRWDGRYHREAVSGARVRNEVAKLERRFGRADWDRYDHFGVEQPYEVLRG